MFGPWSAMLSAFRLSGLHWHHCIMSGTLPAVLDVTPWHPETFFIKRRIARQHLGACSFLLCSGCKTRRLLLIQCPQTAVT